MKKSYRLIWVGICSILLAGAAQAQQVVRGKVTEASDQTPLPGVNILEKGTNNGTLTDSEGNYTITVNEGAVLVYSFVGYLTQEVAVAGRSEVNIGLPVDAVELQEIVVIGYGQQEKKDVTGVVNAVSDESFNRGAIVSPDQLIVGKVAGVQITQNSGEPGGQSTIRIRGGTSLTAGNEPLYVIDGVPLDNKPHDPGGQSKGRNPLNFLNPSDIESFTVLKDASAAAIYGSRAANGVIIITTKRGKAGAPTISYDGWVSVAQIVDRLDVFNADQFRDVIVAKAPKHINLLGDYNTDWQDEVFRTAIGQNHALTLSGGSEKLTYRVSAGRQELEGVVKTSRTQRTSISASLNQKLLDGDLDVTINVKGAQTKDRFTPDIVGPALEMDPTQPVYDAESPFGGYWEWKNADGNYERLGTKNPVSLLRQTQEFGDNIRSVGNLQATYKIKALPGLSATANVGYDIAKGDRRRFLPTTAFTAIADTGEVKIEHISRVSNLLELYGNYNRTINVDHVLDLTVGYSWQDWKSEYPSFVGTVLSDNSYGFNNPAVAERVRAYNSVLENRLISFFGRINYSYRDRYLITTTFRHDASTRFSKQNQWGFFPSTALGWRIIDEDFMANVRDVFTDLKLRIGYGINGNQEILDYRYISVYAPSTATAYYQFGDEFVPTLRPNPYDESLKWEETTSWNAGIDYGFMNGRVTGSLDFYLKNTRDLLLDRTVAPGSNLSNIVLSNIGSLRNRGVELLVDVVAISTNDLNWNVSFNGSYNHNEILSLDGSDDESFVGIEQGDISGGVGNKIQIWQEGQTANAFYVYKHKLDENGNPLRDIDHNENGTVDLADMYEDVNGDGEVNDADRRVYHFPAPKVILGFTSSLNYKRFDLAFTLRANLGNYVYNNVASNTANYSRANDNFVPRNMLTSALKTNFTNPQYFSDYYVENASFLRMDNITLGYSPERVANLRVYATVQNAFILTEYSGLDPEIPTGIDNNLYPRSRTFIFGLNVSF